MLNIRLGRSPTTSSTPLPGRLALPRPATRGALALEETLQRRRSVRQFRRQPIDLQALSQLLWAAQGITGRQGERTAPSAGALYPLETWVALENGAWQYEPRAHALRRRAARDLRADLAAAAHAQECVRDAAAVFVFAAVFERTAWKYGRARAPRYVHLEAGHAAENLLLQAVALGLGGVPVGAFDDAAVARVLGLPADHAPLYLVPVGRPR